MVQTDFGGHRRVGGLDKNTIMPKRDRLRKYIKNNKRNRERIK